MKKVLYIIRGIPGCGKTTFANYIWNDYAIHEADKFFYDKEGNYNFDVNKLHQAHMWCQSEVEIQMKDNQVNPQYYPEIVVSNTSTTEKEMQPYLDLAKKYDYEVFSLIVENRHGGVNQHSVPNDTLDKMEKRMLNNIKLR